MNTLGEIDRLAKVKPNLVLATNAQRDHQEFLDSVSITANENGLAIKALQSGGTTVIPANSDYEEIWLDQAQSVGSDVVRFGIQEKLIICLLKIINMSWENYQELSFDYGSAREELARLFND